MKNNRALIIIFLLSLFIMPFFAGASESATSTPDIVIPEENATSTKSITFHLRYQDALVFEGSWPLGEEKVIHIVDNIGEARPVSSHSVLAVASAIDEANDSFHLSDIAYFASFDSFLINCIEIPAHLVNACFNWQYVVNGVFPFVSTDHYVLEDGDDVFLFFGTPHQVVLEKSEVGAGEEFGALAQNYLYQTNEWEPLSGVTIGVTQENPADPFSPIVIDSALADDLGRAQFILETPGAYQVGIAEDFYFPSVSLTVLTKAATSTPPHTGGGGGGGGGVPPQIEKADVQKAIQFLRNNQHEDGSFGSASLYTDWSAIALGAYGQAGNTKEALMAYLKTDPNPGILLTDYERRAMALMALGINPYSGTKTDYVQAIKEGFDGDQFGSPDLVNDDMFALFPLLNAGVAKEDPMIANTVSFILSRQGSNGSWIGVDVTAAGVQALSKLSSLPGVPEALAKAKEYLQGKQEQSGGFEGNPFSTSWAIQAISALGEQESAWVKSGKTPGAYLFSAQSQDGGIGTGSLDSRIWATSYAIPALLSKTWYDILGTFEKPQAENSSSGGGSTGGGGGVGGSSEEQEENKNPSPEPIGLPLNATSTDELITLPITREISSRPVTLEGTPSLAIQDKTREGEEIIQETILEQEVSEFAEEVSTLARETEPKTLLAYSAQNQIAQNIFTIGVITSLLLGAYLIWRLLQFLAL